MATLFMKTPTPDSLFLQTWDDADEIVVGEALEIDPLSQSPREFNLEDEVVVSPTVLTALPNSSLSVCASAVSPALDSGSIIHDNASLSGDNESDEKKVKSLDLTFEESASKEIAKKSRNFYQPSEYHESTVIPFVPFSETGGKLEVKEKVGEGTFSSVYKAIPTSLYRKSLGIPETEQYVALKRVYPTCSPLRILNEMQHLRKLGGKCNVLPLYGTLRFRDQVTLVIPYFPHDKFKDFVGTISLAEMKKYMKSLFQSLHHLHTNGVIHRDVKPGNFLCNFKEDKYMLVDFGLAEVFPVSSTNNSSSSSSSLSSLSNSQERKTDSIDSSRKRRFEETQQEVQNGHSAMENKMMNSTFRRCTSVESMTLKKPQKQKVLHAARAGTRGFRAPEILLKCQNQTTAIDIWSAGVIFLCILSTRYPFFNSPDDLASLAEIAAVFGTKELSAAAQLLGRRVRFPIEIVKTEISFICQKLSPQRTYTVPETAYNLLSRCLDLNPKTRITAEEALSHPFFNDSFDHSILFNGSSKNLRSGVDNRIGE